MIELNHAPLTVEFQTTLDVECPKDVFTSQSDSVLYLWVFKHNTEAAKHYGYETF